MRVRRAFAAVMVVALFAAVGTATSWALDPAKSVYQYNLQTWTRQTGLGSDMVNCITQSTDGYLWIGTQTGLLRFDGVELKPISIDFAQAGGRDVKQLAPLRSGGMYIAINNGAFIRYDGRAFTELTDSAWPGGLAAKAVLETRDGAVWIGTNLGMGRHASNRSSAGYFMSLPKRAVALAEAPDGTVWIGMEEAGLYRWRNGQLTKFPDESLDREVIFALAVGRSGEVWVGTNHGLRCYAANGQRLETPYDSGVNALLLDSNGALWIGTDRDGLGRLQDGRLTFLRKADGLAGNFITSLFEDNEGSIWVGSGDGLTQISDVRFPIVTSRDGIVDGAAHTVSASRRGGVWITTSQGVSYYDGHTAKNYTMGEVLPDPYVKLGFEMRNGDMAFADGRKNLDIMSHDALKARFAMPMWPEALAEDDEGLLVGLPPKTILRFRDGKLTPLEYKQDEPDFKWFTNMYVAHDGAIWIPGYNGAYRIKDGRYETWPLNTSAEGRAHSMFEDIDGTIWAALPNGIVRIKGGHAVPIRAEQGLFDQNIYAIVADDHGYLWCDASRGIFRVTRENLNAVADGKAKRVDCEVFDGMESVRYTDRIDQEFCGCKTADGRIWFPNGRGVVMIDPVKFFRNTVAPVVRIEQVRVKGRPVPLESPVRLKFGDDQLEFTFAAITFIAANRTRVLYQLEGLDSTWVEAGSRRSVVYNVKPGRYTFRVRAINVDGFESAATGGFTFEVPPPFYETVWFLALMGLCAIAIFVGIYQWKVSKLRERQQRLVAENDALEAKVTARTAELAHERDLLRTLLDNSPDYIYFKDTKSRVVKCCRAYAALFGAKSPEDLVGKTDFDFFDEAHARPAFDAEQQIIRTGQPLLAQVEREVWPDGRITWVLTTKMPWRDHSGNIAGTFGISKDITGLKESEAKLIEVHRQLVEASRHAGMAEVATGVLHNVGNVLNSVNVSASMVYDRIRASRISSVAKVANLLDDHAADLADFIARDARGQKLPQFLAELGRQLQVEQTHLLEEIEFLRRNVDHIKEIVTMQQTFAKISGVVETVSVTEMVEDSVRVQSLTLERAHIELKRELTPNLEITVDRHKVIQILVNLISNAMHACNATSRADKRIVIRTLRTGDVVTIAVEDNGVGIAPENLTRIFGHGFTTRKDGHGFGLHSGALAARELGGTLTVDSDGVGLGAKFILELPVAPAAAVVAEAAAPATAGAI